MKTYETQDIRTIVLVGHGKCGKTSLGEAFLYDVKATTRLGKVDDETSSLDTEPEEIKRKSSIQCALGYCEWKKTKINFIDTPGDGNFAAEAEMAASVADAAVVVVSAPDGVQVGTERSWRIIDNYKLPRAIFINKVDRERASFDHALDEIKSVLTKKAVALQIPIGSEQSFNGVVDLLSLKALSFTDDGREVKVEDIPADLKEQAAAAREELIDGIASTDETLIEKFLEQGDLSEEEINKGLSKAVLDGTIVPVLCGSATRNIGIQPLMDFITKAFPSPLDRPPVKSEDGVERPQTSEAPFSARVFKVIGADIGKIAMLRVVSGSLSSDSTVMNAKRGAKERVGKIYLLSGKKKDTIDRVVAGDLIGLAKLKETKTGDTICDEKEKIIYPVPKIPDPVITYAIRPKSKGEEEKISSKLNDILEEDIALRLDRDSTGMLLRGMGQIHIEMAVEKLKRLGAEVELAEPTVPYRETIKGKAVEVEGKHKKQSGGRGQFGVCFIDMEPKPKDIKSDDPLEFVNAIFGGSIPRQFIPAIEKGIRDRMGKGVIAGFPIVDIKVTLTDGKYHPVDSDGRSFEMAGSKGFQEAFKRSHPILLEPIMTLEVTCPDENMGDIIGDVSSRRGKVLGTEGKSRKQVIKAQIPMAEILRYAIDLESITAGRGEFTVTFSHYEEVPSNLAEKIVASAKIVEDED